jgi:Spy/CpxP family protein refolding chaperone
MIKYTIAPITLFLALVSFSANAQMADRLTEHPSMHRVAAGHKVPAEDPVAVTREMTVRLHLNEGQFLKLLPLNRTKIAGMNSINREYKNDEAVRAAKAAELEAQYEQECSRILTPSQLSQLQQNNQPAAAPAGTGNGLG